MNSGINSKTELILELLLRKLNIMNQVKVMSLSPVDNDITSISNMLSERQEYLDQVEVLDREINDVINSLPVADKSIVKSIITQKNIPENLTEYLLNVDKAVKKIYNEVEEILSTNRELNEKLLFIKDNLIMQIKQVNNNNQIFKYSSGTLGITPGSMLDKKQ